MKKELLAAIILVIVLAILASMAIMKKGPLRDKLSSSPKLEEALEGAVDKFDELSSRVSAIAGKEKEPPHPLKGADARQVPGEMIVLYFKDGSVIEGELLKETKEKYVVNWKGVAFDVYADQVGRIARGKEALEEKATLLDEEIARYWPYKNDVVIRLTNRRVLDAEIISVEEDKLGILYLMEDGGRIEQDIERSKVEYLIFKPVDNRKSREIGRSLKELFPEMEFYREGSFTIVTDSYIDWVKKYRKTLREVYTNLYFKFFGLFNDRKPEVHNFIVIFDDYVDFIEYAIADGVPGWAVAGYFSPRDEALYLFNVLGDRFSELLFEALVGESGRTVDDFVERVEEHVDKRYQIFIEGHAMTIKNKFWEAYDYYKAMFRESTLDTLRHEFTHEVFHNWGLQNIILSEPKTDRTKLIKKKKEFLEAKDHKKKARLIRSLISLKRNEPLDMKAANSWLAEGIATYCETYLLGNQNERWLFLYQEMAREGPIYPLESLTFHKIGSFPGVAPKAMLYSYAQSWAFVSFLMDRYPREFMDYQKKLAEKTVQGHEDIKWLLEAIGKDLGPLREEFAEYMNTYQKVDDPFVSHFTKLHDIFKD